MNSLWSLADSLYGISIVQSWFKQWSPFYATLVLSLHSHFKTIIGQRICFLCIFFSLFFSILAVFSNCFFSVMFKVFFFLSNIWHSCLVHQNVDEINIIYEKVKLMETTLSSHLSKYMNLWNMCLKHKSDI